MSLTSEIFLLQNLVLLFVHILCSIAGACCAQSVKLLDYWKNHCLTNAPIYVISCLLKTHQGLHTDIHIRGYSQRNVKYMVIDLAKFETAPNLANRRCKQRHSQFFPRNYFHYLISKPIHTRFNLLDNA